KGGNWQESGDLMMQLVEKAKKRASVKVVPIPGRENESVIKNIIHTLNTSTPVVIGANWPNIKILGNNPTLSTQKAAGGHAVTLVGYKNKTGSLEGVTFIFRNSWGHRWGVGGYGFIRYEYLEKHLTEALVLELD
ncbi:MAG: C1 family peptidase, partial [Verrucomicrobiota bacterium]